MEELKVFYPKLNIPKDAHVNRNLPNDGSVQLYFYDRSSDKTEVKLEKAYSYYDDEYRIKVNNRPKNLILTILVIRSSAHRFTVIGAHNLGTEVYVAKSYEEINQYIAIIYRTVKQF